MKTLRHYLILLSISIISSLLINCEKVDPSMELLDDPTSELNTSALKATPMDVTAEIDYLLGLIETIETLLEEGLLNKGNANALIVKIENAIKSLEKGNDSAAENQLGAVINQVEDFVENGVIPEDIGEELVNKVENYEILSEGSFIDPRDGNKYNVVLIGDQLWMAENLKATKFNDGTDIPQVTENANWALSTSPAYCWYNNDYDSYGRIYGALYNWHVVETGKLCPEGWHTPTIEEWATLADYLGGYSVSGGKLKETGTTHWLSPNTEATNESEFTALPSGIRYTWGGFSGIHSHCYWWTSSLYFTSTDAHCLALTWLDGSLWPQTGILNIGMAVRCIKN